MGLPGLTQLLSTSGSSTKIVSKHGSTFRLVTHGQAGQASAAPFQKLLGHLLQWALFGVLSVQVCE
jgi:hypothetical protein